MRKIYSDKYHSMTNVKLYWQNFRAWQDFYYLRFTFFLLQWDIFFFLCWFLLILLFNLFFFRDCLTLDLDFRLFFKFLQFWWLFFLYFFSLSFNIRYILLLILLNWIVDLRFWFRWASVCINRLRLIGDFISLELETCQSFEVF